MNVYIYVYIIITAPQFESLAAKYKECVFIKVRIK